MPNLGDKLIQRMKQLEDVKQDYDERDYNIARFVNPRRELIEDSQRFDDKGKERGKGERFHGKRRSERKARGAILVGRVDLLVGACLEEDVAAAVDRFVGDRATEPHPCALGERGKSAGEFAGDPDDLGVGRTAGHEHPEEAHPVAIRIE